MPRVGLTRGDLRSRRGEALTREVPLRTPLRYRRHASYAALGPHPPPLNIRLPCRVRQHASDTAAAARAQNGSLLRCLVGAVDGTIADARGGLSSSTLAPGGSAASPNGSKERPGSDHLVGSGSRRAVWSLNSSSAFPMALPRAAAPLTAQARRAPAMAACDGVWWAPLPVPLRTPGAACPRLPSPGRLCRFYKRRHGAARRQPPCGI